MPEQSTRSRWPAWVYGTGSDPDYRFSFANERTFLAWIRTSLALVAGGVALDAMRPSLNGAPVAFLAAALLVLGGLCAAVAWSRWARAERALRRREALPAPGLTVILAGALLAAVAVLVVGHTLV